MYIHMYVCMYACNACMHLCKYACMYVCMYACMYVCMYVCNGLQLCRTLVILFYRYLLYELSCSSKQAMTGAQKPARTEPQPWPQIPDTYAYVYVYIYIYMCYVYMYVYICLCVCRCLYVHLHTYIHLCIYIYIWYPPPPPLIHVFWASTTYSGKILRVQGYIACFSHSRGRAPLNVHAAPNFFDRYGVQFQKFQKSFKFETRPQIED